MPSQYLNPLTVDLHTTTFLQEVVAIEKVRIDIKIEEKLTSKISKSIINRDAKARSMELTKSK